MTADIAGGASAERAGPGAGDNLTPRRGDRLALFVVFSVLLGVYLATLAPDITLWDSGEFNAAIASLGIPHPPGTPLFVLLARVWSRALGMLPQALAVNALSAVATATACALLARAFARWTGSRMGGIAAGLTAGGLFAVWQNATETEVYALSLLLGVAMVVAGDRAGRTGAVRDQAMLAYLIGLAVPLQISALVAAPAAIALAATPCSRRGGISGGGVTTVPGLAEGLALGGAFVVAVGIGLVSPAALGVGFALVVVATLVASRRSPRRWAVPWTTVAMTVLGASALCFMLVRAAHDPGINQGNPVDWRSFLDLVARRQYDVPGLWPRRAPLWLQMANLAQYADWQVAIGLDDAVSATWRRTPFTIVFGALAVAGARWHWRSDRRSAIATMLLLACASLGVVAVLNLRAGPSIGAGILPPEALHEARERDYFFALAFAVAGLWAGAGAVSVAGRLLPGRAGAGVVIAALPIVINWREADRRVEPDASLAPLLGEAILESAPAAAVVLLAGDNDSYAVWYEQQAKGRRPDVTPVTLPLLGAEWYREELARRHDLLEADAVAGWRGEEETLRRVVAAATAAGRPVAASIAIPRELRLTLGDRWRMSGMVFARLPSAGATVFGSEESLDLLDERTSADIAGLVSRRISRSSFPARDGTGRYIHRLLNCPGLVLSVHSAAGETERPTLDSLCNFK